MVSSHKDRFGVEPVCRQLHAAGIKIAPSTYYAQLIHTPSSREKRDRVLINLFAGLSDGEATTFALLIGRLAMDTHTAQQGTNPCEAMDHLP